MSLSKQLLILISALFLMIFSVNFGLSVSNIKAYMEGEAQNHAQDTATSLGLSLSPYMSNPGDPIIKTMVSAIFDMGYYREIRLVDAGNQELLDLSNDKVVEGIPEWFVDYLPMTQATAESEISTGWTLGGVVYVTVNSSFAYSKLYEQAKASFYYSLATFIIAMMLLVMVLRLTLASLTRINQQALEIAEGRFETIEHLPWTSEVKNVAVSMNIMSRKIETTLKTLNHKLEAMGASLLRDDLSGLYKKAVFETDMMRLLAEHNPAYLVLIKVDSLPELVKERGNDSIDQLLQAIAEQLQKIAQQHPDTGIKSYRFYGGEFAMLIHNDKLELIEAIAKSLTAALAQLGQTCAKPDLAHLGLTLVLPVSTPESILKAAYEAYEQARLIGPNSYYFRDHDNTARDLAAWKALVFACIDSATYSLSYQGRINECFSGQIIMEEAFTHVHDEYGKWVAVGPFVSIAEKFAKIIELDKGVIDKALHHIQAQRLQHAIAVNLSTRTIKNSEFRLWLEKLLKTNPVAVKQLVFSFSAYAIAKDVATHVEFFYKVHQWGGRVMIKRFETQSISPDIIKQLKPDFVRLARELSNGISHSSQKHDFVQTMQQLSDLLDIAMLAENVQAESDFQTLKAIGIVGASR